MPYPATKMIPLSVLYVDDEPALLEIGRIFLERIGDLTVTTALCASEAISLLSNQSFDAIISDYQMPGCDGIAFLKHLRKHGDTTPFIIFTGKGREDVVIEALNEGADFYLQKGGDPKPQFAELYNIIQYAVARQLALRDIEEAGERYKALIAVSNTGAWEYDLGSGFLWCSPEYFSMIGRDPAEFDFSGSPNLNEVWFHLIHPEDRDQAIRHFMEYLTSLSPGMYENDFRMEHADGRWIWIQSRGWRLHNADKELTDKTIGTHIDVTEKKKAEEQILLKNIIFESSITGNSIADNKGLITDANPAFLRMWKYQTKEEIIKKPVSGFFANEEDAAGVLLELDTTGRWEGEFIAQRSDGSSFTALGTATTIHNENGDMIGYQSTCLDITDRKAAEEELRAAHEQLAASEEELRGQCEQLVASEEEISQQLDEIVGKEKLLALSEERYRAIFEHTESPTIIIEDDTSISLANNAFIEISGYPPEEVIGRSWTEFVSQQDRDRMVAFHHQRRMKGADPPQRYDFLFLSRNGKTHTINLTVGLIPGTRQSVASFHDLTGTKQIEMALRESEEQYRRIVDTSADGIWQMDSLFRITYVNERMAEMLGYSPEEMIGLCVSSFISPGEHTDYEQRRQVQKNGEVDYFERCFIRKDGKNLWARVAITPIFDADGVYQGSFAMLSDITGRKAAEEALRESEKKYRLIADNTADCICIYDLDFNPLYVSPSVQVMKGFSVEESLVQTPDEIWTPASFASLLPLFHREMERERSGTAEPKRTFCFETEEYCKDGSTIMVENSARWLRDEGGRPVGIIGISRDITDRKKAE
ncbi:MAG: PAS domain S-box protein [Methanospirillaceae archaeon]|nr:PAS domain S-box protein [Methanospirillaceae archaeon]